MADFEREDYSVYFQTFSYVRDNMLSRFCSKEMLKIKKADEMGEQKNTSW